MALKAVLAILFVAALAHRGIAANLKIPFPYTAVGSDRKARTVPCIFTISVVSIKKEKQVRVGNIAADFAPVATQALAAALVADKKSRVFRLLWHTSGFRAEFDNIVLYDREHHTLKFVCSGYSGDESYQTTEYRCCLLNRVTDKMISRLAAPPTESSDFTWGLVHFGAKMQTGDDITNTAYRWGSPKRKNHWHYPPSDFRH